MGLFDSFGSSVSGLNANTAALQTVQHNIANVNTEGYSRQRVEFGTRFPEPIGSDFLGNGVEIASINRVFDELVLRTLQSSTSTFKEAEKLLDSAEQVDDILANPGTGINSGLNDFFATMNGLADDPSNFGARETLFTEAQTFTSRLNTLDDHFDSLRTFVNNEIRSFVSDVNQLAQNIADVNNQILAFPLDQAPPDLLDQRDQLITLMAEQVSVTTSKQSDGSLSVFIGNGQGLVIGTFASTVAVQNNAEDPTNLDITISAGGTVTNVTSQIVGGKIGGLNTFRNTILDRSQNTIGQIAAAFTVQMNLQHRLGQDLDGNLGGDLFTEPTIKVSNNLNNTGAGVITGAYGDTTNLTTSDYRLTFDGTNFSLIRLDDGTTTTPVITGDEVDGVIITIAGAAAAGDSFLIQPTRDASGEVARSITNSRQIASALPVRISEATNANGLGTNTGDANVTNLVVNSVANLPLPGGNVQIVFDAVGNQFNLVPDTLTEGPLAYNPATDSPTTFTILGGISFTVTGTPDNTDTFVLADNTGGVSDNGNALTLTGLQSVQTMNGNTSTFNGTDSQLVTTIGTLTRSANINEEATEALFFQAKERREAVSGVNLDEEAANLIKFQQAFQANAQVIQATTTLFDTLLSVI